MALIYVGKDKIGYGHLWKPTFAEIAFEWQAGKALAFTAGPGALPQREERRMLAIRT